VYYPDYQFTTTPTLILAHRGGGGNALYRENSFEAIKAALRTTDGIETDVQISKNETIWLSHSSDVLSCSQSYGCFSQTLDADIQAIDSCNGTYMGYTRLREVLEFVRDSFPDKIISIDLKPWPPCSAGGLNIAGCMNREAEIIIGMARSYNLTDNIRIETETTSVLNFIKSISPQTAVYLTAFGDFERALFICMKEKYSGISYKNNDGEVLTKEKIDLLHRKGLKIMVWNLQSENETDELTAIGVDCIQKDLK
jgi:glycerophosphoryl diester phosphodiesterase